MAEISHHTNVRLYIHIQGKALEDNNVSTQETNENEDTETRDQQRTAEKVNKKLGQIPLIFILLQVWGAWGYLAMLYKPSPNWLIILQVTLFFFITPTIIGRYINMRYCCCKKPSLIG